MYFDHLRIYSFCRIYFIVISGDINQFLVQLSIIHLGDIESKPYVKIVKYKVVLSKILYW